MEEDKHESVSIWPELGARQTPISDTICDSICLDHSVSHVEMKLSIFLLACCARRLLDQFAFFLSISILAHEKAKLVVICRFGVASMIELLCVRFFWLVVVVVANLQRSFI